MKARVVFQGLPISSSKEDGLKLRAVQIAMYSMAQPECQTPACGDWQALELVTPLLPELLSGQIHLSSECEGSTFHIYLVIEGQGLRVKLEGSVDANKQTSQLTSHLDEDRSCPSPNPGVHLEGGPCASWPIQLCVARR